MYVKKQITTLEAYSLGKGNEQIKQEFGLDKVVKLSANENPFGCSPKVYEVLRSISKHVSCYPDGASKELSEKVSDLLKIDREQLLFGSGADEVIQILSRALLDSKHNIVQATPTFSQYELHAIIEGAEVRNVPLVNGIHNLDGMLEQIDNFTKIVWICNPNNPTGTYVNQEKLEVFLQSVPTSTVVVVDEAYVEYATAQDFPKTIPLLQKYENLMILRTFSKVYGLASFRIGYGIGCVKLISELNKTRLPYNTTMISQMVAIAALEDQNFIKNCVIENVKGFFEYAQFLDKNGISYYPSEANFIYIEVKNSKEIFEKLESQGFIIRKFPNAIRITIGTQLENRELIRHLSEILT